MLFRISPEVLKKYFIYFQIEGRGEEEREENIDWLPLTNPQLGTHLHPRDVP